MTIVGGIYTVIKTKTAVTTDEYGDNYCLIGPYAHGKAPLEIEEKEPTCLITRNAVKRMRESGVRVVCGKWLVEGSPNVILFDLGSASCHLNEWKADLWERASIPSPHVDIETNDAILFGYLVAWFLGEFSYFKPQSLPVLAHFHEWMAGVGAILVKKRALRIATIFTTHATLLGRYLCSGNVDFYNNLKCFNEDEEAGKRGIYHRYCLERAAAHCADVFTTVSHITAYEAEHLLKRKPDGVTPNGLNSQRFSTMHELHNLHNESKNKIHSFVRGHFYGQNNFDFDNTLYFFIAGRYEYRNKGVDLFLEALARLNHHLRQYNSSMSVVAFIIMPAATNNHNVEALKGQAVTKQLHDVVQAITNRVGERIFDSALRGTVLPTHKMLSEDDVILLKRHMLALRRDTLPPIVTHNMVDSGGDPILMELRRLQLFNSPLDPVKVVFHPEFLSAHNPVLGMEYEDFVRGCHLGVFPSYYEPWGYTPAECTVMGIPSVTTNLSGFGCFMEENVENPTDYGVYIVDRRLKSVEESVRQLTDYFIHFCKKTRRQRITMRNRTERLSDLLDWSRMGMEYRKARQLALKRVFPEALDDHESADLEGGIGEAPLEKIPRPPSAPPTPTSIPTDSPVKTGNGTTLIDGADGSSIPTIDLEAFQNMKLNSVITLVDATRG